MALLSVHQAAQRLGISERRARALIQSGDLDARKVGHVWAIEEGALRPLEERRNGRPLSPANAWALLASLERARVEWVDPAVRSRLMRKARDPSWLVEVLRSSQPRSEIHRLRVLERDLESIEADFKLVPGGLSSDLRELDLVSPPGALDAYVSGHDLAEIERRFRPIGGSSAPNLVLRIPSHPWILALEMAPLGVVAADLLDHEDPRVRRAARKVVIDLASYRDP